MYIIPTETQIMYEDGININNEYEDLQRKMVSQLTQYPIILTQTFEESFDSDMLLQVNTTKNTFNERMESPDNQNISYNNVINS